MKSSCFVMRVVDTRFADALEAVAEVLVEVVEDAVGFAVAPPVAGVLVPLADAEAALLSFSASASRSFPCSAIIALGISWNLLLI